MLRTRTAEVILHEGWCVVATVLENVHQSLDDARENLAAAVKTCGGVRRPLLVEAPPLL